PPVALAGPATWDFEGGLRYFFSAGTPREKLGDPDAPGQLNSRLTYANAQAHAGESFARLEHNPTGLFAKGFLGTGGVTGGRLADEDFPPALRRYSKTLSPIKDGDVGYGVVDVGYDVLRRDGYKLGGFIGYQFASELYNGYGCRQVAGGAPCARPYPTGMKTLGESMQWNALRVGVIGEARFDRVRLSLEGAYLPVVSLSGVDRHWLRPDINPGPEGGRGDGYFLEGIISYDLTPSVSVGVGGRYWQLQADKAHTTAFPFSPPSPMKFETGRYGGFLRRLLLLGPVIGFSLISIGSVLAPPIQEAVGSLLTDATFTGRSEIWQFAIDNIMIRPWRGWGIGAFWMTERTMYAGSEALTWVNTVDHAHNAYLDTALIGGLPFLALTVVAFVLAPVRDLQRVAGGTRLDAETLLFLRLWFLGLVSASFETVLYNGNNATCCMFMMAVFGLRLRTRYAVAAG
ncbi:O-antigen ligase family protein, partial [Methylobacterium organophilum]|nr:O-antigen ligase family protein [Methylobacterium organophilum]